ncbi:MAG: hypothetical protein ACKO40_01755 [Planctomycetaceae bacterium]
MSDLLHDVEELEHDASSEYERQKVPQKALKGPSAFWGMYAGEHTAGTEFMIGPLFVKWGADAFSLIVGLFLGNLLAGFKGEEPISASEFRGAAELETSTMFVLERTGYHD